MLRSTGFFRSIDCPYWAGAAGGPCRRPYCHFRHRGARGPGAPWGGGAASPAAGKACATAPGPPADPARSCRAGAPGDAAPESGPPRAPGDV